MIDRFDWLIEYRDRSNVSATKGKNPENLENARLSEWKLKKVWKVNY